VKSIYTLKAIYMKIGWKPLKSETFSTFATTFAIATIGNIRRPTSYRTIDIESGETTCF
jgi:hypothetical protein